jgi:hypothetical protein
LHSGSFEGNHKSIYTLSLRTSPQAGVAIRSPIGGSMPLRGQSSVICCANATFFQKKDSGETWDVVAVFARVLLLKGAVSEAD